MMKLIALLCMVTVESALIRKSARSEESHPDACEGISCAIIECVPPFVTKTPDDLGTCCPVCVSEIKVPEDRSWAAGLSGGIGPNNNADMTLCRDVVCLKPDCPEFDQGFDGRCCTKCKSSMETVTASDRKLS